MPDYSSVDASPITNYIFYPRPDFSQPPEGAFDLFVPVAPGIQVSCRFYIGDPKWPLILYFHGNGEVVSDYDGISPLYHQRQLNLAVADYRGYGASGGSPTLTAVTQDCHLILASVQETMTRRQLSGNLWVMGRSLGSTSAIELACRGKTGFRALIIESGFASILPIMGYLGLPVALDHDEVNRIEKECLAMVREITMPTLVMHGEHDTLVPLFEAQKLHEHLGSSRKELLIIPGADHNDIMFTDPETYFDAIRNFIAST
jgi:hypothetical protein